jgi:hypothetical protein
VRCLRIFRSTIVPPSACGWLYLCERSGASSPGLKPGVSAPKHLMTTPSQEPAAPAQETTTLSRRNALKAGAAGLAALLTLSHITPSLAAELTRLAQDKPMTGARLAEILHAERTQWNALLDQVGLDRMDIPGVEGEWSVKQLVAHLTWYELAVVEGAQQALNTGTFSRRRPEGMSLDEMNAPLAEESRARPASDVLAEADAVFEQLLALIAACPDAILNDPQLLGLPDDMPPWMRVANNSFVSDCFPVSTGGRKPAIFQYVYS